MNFCFLIFFIRKNFFEFQDLINKNGKKSLIIDAGANIGASPLYFLNNYKNSLVYSIEPQLNNFLLLEANTSSYTNKINFRGAIASKDGHATITNPNAPNYSFQTQLTTGDNNFPDNVEILKSISIPTILDSVAKFNCQPLILKIDIEGAEKDLFANESEWVNQFPLIIIEPHDWMLPFSSCTKNLIKCLNKYDFDIVLKKDEKLFLFNYFLNDEKLINSMF